MKLKINGDENLINVGGDPDVLVKVTEDAWEKLKPHFTNPTPSKVAMILFTLSRYDQVDADMLEQDLSMLSVDDVRASICDEIITAVQSMLCAGLISAEQAQFVLEHKGFQHNLRLEASRLALKRDYDKLSGQQSSLNYIKVILGKINQESVSFGDSPIVAALEAINPTVHELTFKF